MSKQMKDGTTAYLTVSGLYYSRREPDEKIFDKIVYYDLEGNHIPLAKGRCKKCKEIIESRMCGQFVSCKCGKAFVDTDRWMPERHRYGGEIKQLNK